MKRIAVPIAVLILLVLSLSAAAYAYNSSVSAPGSLSSTSHSIDLLDADGNPLGSELSIPAPAHDGLDITDTSYEIQGKLKVSWNSGTSGIRAWANLPAQAWAYVDNIVFAFNGTAYVIDDGAGDTGGPTVLIPSVADGTYGFTITVNYNDHVLDVTDDSENDVFVPGSFTFAASATDPLSS